MITDPTEPAMGCQDCEAAPLTLCVDESRLLQEVGLMFGGVPTALGEIVQNSYRAGATQLRVDVSGRFVTFRDNGPGLADPRALFTVARSGWAPGVAHDPAGMGAFAAFSPSMADHVEVISRPAGAAHGWAARFGPEAFTDRTPIDHGPIPSDGSTGLELRILLKEDVRLPNLLDSAWRHRFPLEVLVSMDGADPIGVPPVPEVEGIPIATPVGPVTIRRSRIGFYTQSRAVWEHRLVEFPGDSASKRLRGRFPSTLVGSVLTTILDESAIEWVVDTSACTTKARLPDRTHLIQDAGLESALDAIAESMLASIDEENLRKCLLEAVGDNPIIRTNRYAKLDLDIWGEAFRVSLYREGLMPSLGYVRASAARSMDYLNVSFRTDAGSFESRWSSATTSVWVRPLYRTESPEAAILALGDGIPAVFPQADSPSLQDLPLLRIEADTLMAARSIGHLFAHGLRYVSGDRVVAPVTRPFIWSMEQTSAHLALSERWAVAVESMTITGTDDDDPCDEDATTWFALHPVPSGTRVIDFVRSTFSFGRAALRESDSGHEDSAVNFWDFVEPGDDYSEPFIDEARLIRTLANLLAEELGPTTASEVRRESLSQDLAARCSVVRAALRESLLSGPGDPPKNPLQEGAELGLAPDLLRQVEEISRKLFGVLTGISSTQLLGGDEASPSTET